MLLQYLDFNNMNTQNLQKIYDPYAQFTKHVLPNGLEVHYAFIERPWIKTSIVVHSGGREDILTLPGLAHFVEHVVSENIPGLSFDNSQEFFETCGGSAYYGATTYLATNYSFNVPAYPSTYKKSLSIFGGMLLQAKLTKGIEQERRAINQEFAGCYPIIEKLQWHMAAQKSLFKGHRLETWNCPLGRPEGFNQTTRANLQAFYDQHYTPKNMSLVIMGGLPLKEVLRLLKKSPFGIKKEGKRTPIPNSLKVLPLPILQSRRIKLSDYTTFKTDQTEYRASWAFPTTLPTAALRVFCKMLDTILLEEIRMKRGLAYSIRSDYASFQDVRSFGISGRVKPDATDTIDSLVHHCIEMVMRRRALFTRKQMSVTKSCLMTDLSGTDLVDNTADDLEWRHRVLPLQEMWEKLHAVRFTQMKEAVDLLSPKRQYTQIICP